MSARLRSTVSPPSPTTVQVTDPQPAAPASVAPQLPTFLTPEVNTDSSTGLTFQLETVPDFRFPLLSWLYTLARVVSNTAYQTNPYASPASAIGYTLIMYVAFLFHTDDHHLTEISPAAHDVRNDATFSRFFDMLLDLPVPDFAHNEFAALQAFLPDDAPSLAFLSSLACSKYYNDYGRHFSANVFFLAHNLLATLPANTPSAQLQWRYYNTVVNTVHIGQNMNANITPGNLFGRIHGDNTVTNWLNERIDALINTLTIRAVNQNNIVAAIDFPTVALANARNYNPYLFLTALTHTSAGTITSAVQNLARWTKDVFPASKTLRHYLQPGSSEHTNYLFLDNALPTWNTTPITASGPDMPTSKLSDTELATLNGFLTVPQPPSEDEVDGQTIFNLALARKASPEPTHPMYAILQHGNRRPDPYVNPIPYTTYKTEQHYSPNMYIFAPYVNNLGGLGTVITSGKLIETGDISGIMQSVPSPSTPLLYENSQFHEGAIRLDRTKTGLFHPGTQTLSQTRPSRRSRNGPAAFFRGLTRSLRLPMPSAGPLRTQPSLQADFNRIAPGAYSADHSVDMDHAVNVFGNDLSTDLRLGSAAKFNIWSSFRFRYATPEGQTIFILPSLRHIYGAKSRSYGTVHPSLRVPL
jgi:hypothetical protein